MSEFIFFTPDQLERQHALAKQRDRLRIRGHAAPPGTGPAGETCRSCQHYMLRQMAGTYRKCGLRDWTRGPGTDIRASDPACEKWKKQA
jgi:hypothetical protein